MNHPLFPTAALLCCIQLLAASPARAEDPSDEDCLACHQSKDNVAANLVVKPGELKSSPHNADSGVSCVSCHTKAAKVADVSDHGKLGKASCGGCHEAGDPDHHDAHGPKLAPGKRPTCGVCHGKRHDIKRNKDPESGVHPSHQPETCGRCHDEHLVENFMRSVHGKRLQEGKADGPSCSTCHKAHQRQLANINRNPEFKVQMVAVCSGCHAKEGKEYRPSVHGEALLKRAVYDSASCVDCHLSHQILPPKDPGSNVHPTKVVKDCAGCHNNAKLIRRLHLPEGVVDSYSLSYHGKAGELGDSRVATCSSCHEQHAIFAPADPRSSVNPRNVDRSCGKCHPGATAKLLETKIHARQGSDGNYWAWVVRTIYLWLILLVIGGMVLHNLLDFIRKLINRARQQKREPHVIRMDRSERIMHLLLLSSFITLAYTGFALMYPKEWWVAPLNWISNSEAFRSTVHRVAGVVMTLVAVQHLWFLFFSRRGREQRRAFVPRWRDVRDLFANLAFFFGRRQQRPRFGRFSYMEKAEYWALVWGTVVMVLTGFIMWFEEWALGFMPLWLWEVFHVVHRFEAILAALAILVWHFYYVMVNPDEAPLSLTWITGRMTHHELALGHAEELEEIEQQEDLPDNEERAA